MNKTAVARNIVSVRSCEHAIPDALLQPATHRIQHASEEFQAVIAWADHVVAAVQIKGELTVKKCFHEFPTLYRCGSIVSEDDKVIAVTQVFLDAERVFHVPVEFVQVDVRKYLARHIADGDAARRFKSTLSLSALPTPTFVV